MASLYRKARPEELVNAQAETVNAHVNAHPLADGSPQPKKSRSGSKHPPGYMAEYMRKRRAK